jgi:hypothetical protein
MERKTENTCNMQYQFSGSSGKRVPVVWIFASIQGAGFFYVKKVPARKGQRKTFGLNPFSLPV